MSEVMGMKLDALLPDQEIDELEPRSTGFLSPGSKW
jgi:hypothetical protein